MFILVEKIFGKICIKVIENVNINLIVSNLVGNFMFNLICNSNF